MLDFSLIQKNHIYLLLREYFNIYKISTFDISLWYSRYFFIELIGFINADFASCKLDRKSTS